MQTNNNSSEVARLRAQIIAEHEAALRGMAGIAEGVARHSFINAHMNRIGILKNELECLVGDSEAMTMICQMMLEEQ